jgi:hypothetical protein
VPRIGVCVDGGDRGSRPRQFTIHNWRGIRRTHTFREDPRRAEGVNVPDRERSTVERIRSQGRGTASTAWSRSPSWVGAWRYQDLASGSRTAFGRRTSEHWRSTQGVLRRRQNRLSKADLRCATSGLALGLRFPEGRLNGPIESAPARAHTVRRVLRAGTLPIGSCRFGPVYDSTNRQPERQTPLWGKLSLSDV